MLCIVKKQIDNLNRLSIKPYYQFLNYYCFMSCFFFLS